MVKAQAPASKPTGKKISGIKVTVVGQAAIKGDRRTDLMKYEESFFLPASVRKEVLHVVRRFLIEPRLQAKEAQFRLVRTCGIKTIGIVDDIGLSAIRMKKVEDMTGEEVRTLVICEDWPRELLEDVAVDFDLIERVSEFMTNPKHPLRTKKKKVADPDALDQVDSEDDRESGAGIQALGTKWKDLDEK